VVGAVFGVADYNLFRQPVIGVKFCAWLTIRTSRTF